MAFVPLFCQSHHSPRGVCSCAELVERARALGYATLGLCDEATMAGFQEFDDACRDHSIRPVFGCRLIVDGFVITDSKFPLDFLIEGEQGYRNLVRLLTQYHERREGEGLVRKTIRLQGRTTGLRVVAPPDGELPQLVRLRDRVKIEEYLAKLVEACGYACAIGVDASDADAETGMMLRRLATFVKVPAVAAPRIFYAEPGDAPAFLFLASPESAPDRGYKPPDEVKTLPALFSADDITARFPEGDDAVHESGEIARKCGWRPSVNRRIIPTQDFERGFDANSYLFDLVIRGATERYGTIKEDIKQRISDEFEEIKSRDLATYLLLFRQITSYIDGQGISRGVGRGSVVASVLAYCLGITRLDPLHYRLTHQPIAGENETYPPLRIEVPGSAAPKLLQWLGETFGENHLVQIGRRQEIRREQLIEQLAAWAGMTDEERRLALKEKSRTRLTAAQRLLQTAEERRWKRWRDPAFVVEIAAQLAPRPGELVPSAGRWTLSSEPLEYVIPVVEGPEGSKLTDIGDAAIDRLGGPRLEFASHHLLNLLDRARLATAEGVPGFSLNKIPLDDKATFELLSRGDTIGIQPLEGISVKALLRKRRPGNILQLLGVKTEAAHGRTMERDRSLMDELPDVLVSYQCAYFRANYPQAYFAGALSSVAEIGGDVNVLVRAMRRARMEILPPDINLSSAFSTVQAGKIRLGLRMIRQFGEKAWEEIQSVRRGGRFNTLAGLCESVSPRVINLRLLQNLISAGAFDGFGQSRAQMSALVTTLQRKNRAAADAQPEETTAQFTLFDLSAIEREHGEENHTEPAQEEEWDGETTLRREREALGFNLAGDPLDRFPQTMAALEPLSPEAITHRLAGRRVRVAGLIDHADTEGPLVEFEGALMIDLEGLPVWLNPILARLSHRAIVPGTEALVIGEVTTDKGYLRIDAVGLWRLEDLEDQSNRVATVQIDLAGENKATLKHLTSLAKEFRGGCKIEPMNYGAPKGWNYRLLTRQRVFFCSPFYQGLCKILPTERVGLLDAEGRPLRIALPDNGASMKEPI